MTARVAIVGAGAAGVMTAVRLIELAGLEGCPVEVHLFDPDPVTGRGIAYGTRDPHHLMNTPATRVSAHPDDPEHFRRWLCARSHDAGTQPYAPRSLYGHYLADLLDETACHGGPAELRRCHRRVGRLETSGADLWVVLDEGTRLRFDAAVLAVGVGCPGLEWVPAELAGDPRFVPDPWAPGALSRIPDGTDVLIVGTGLTMVDVASSLLDGNSRRVHAISRHGLLPAAHADPGRAPAATPTLPHGSLGLDAVRRGVLRHLASSRRRHGDWRPGMDALRPVTSVLWRQLPPADRIRFLRTDLRLWDTHRHRMPPPSAVAISNHLAAGRLHVTASTVAGVTSGELLHVRLTDGRVAVVSAVVNCTGPGGELTVDPLIAGLLSSGVASRDRTGLGLRTTDEGRLVGSAGRPDAPVWTLGALRRGELLETTAMPEIRVQAAHVAAALLRTIDGAERL